ncbi:DUF3329 domain-containing protein [Clostridium chrysemydis]|uniref:DUF3329 domain-containing protein n=1 Tax=Clostridium chrysemydis TaxID=2665504 RepID=UPI003F2A38B9
MPVKVKKMSRFEKLNRSNVIFIAINIFAFSAILFMTYVTPLLADDFNYKFMFGSTQRVSSISDIFVSQYHHYFEWGGRSVAHTLVQLFLSLDKWIFNLCNSLVFVFLGVFIYMHINGKSILRDKKNNILMIVIYMLMWLGIPAFSDCVLWLTGSFNYMWMMMIILGFLLPYRFLLTKNFEYNIPLVILIFALGILAGWTNENTGIFSVLGAVAVAIYLLKNNQRVPKWSIAGIIGSCIGYALLVFAPGNYVRASNFNLSLLEKIEKFLIELPNKFSELGNLTIYCLIIMIFVCIALVSNESKRPGMLQIKMCIFWFVAAIFSIGAMVISPYFPERAMFGAAIMVIISVGIMLNYALDNMNKLSEITILVVVLIIGVMSVSVALDNVPQMIKFNSNVKARTQIIIDAKNAGKMDVDVNSVNLDKRSKYIPESVLSSDPEFWVNKVMASYYELNSIKVN